MNTFSTTAGNVFHGYPQENFARDRSYKREQSIGEAGHVYHYTLRHNFYFIVSNSNYPLLQHNTATTFNLPLYLPFSPLPKLHNPSPGILLFSVKWHSLKLFTPWPFIPFHPYSYHWKSFVPFHQLLLRKQKTTTHSH